MFALGRYVPSFLPPPMATKGREMEREVRKLCVYVLVGFLFGWCFDFLLNDSYRKLGRNQRKRRKEEQEILTTSWRS